MKYSIELNEADIKDIIAEHFDVTANNIKLVIEKQCVGYGPMEHETNIVKVFIEGLAMPGGLRT